MDFFETTQVKHDIYFVTFSNKNVQSFLSNTPASMRRDRLRRANGGIVLAIEQLGKAEKSIFLKAYHIAINLNQIV